MSKIRQPADEKKNEAACLTFFATAGLRTIELSFLQLGCTIENGGPKQTIHMMFTVGEKGMKERRGDEGLPVSWTSEHAYKQNNSVADTRAISW